MEFKKFSAGKFSYGNSNRKFTIIIPFFYIADNRDQMRLNMDHEDGDEISNVNFDDPQFYQHFRDNRSENYTHIERVLLNLAICHTIIIENKNGKLNYNASSPDELALVNAARFFGVKYVERDEENNIFIDFKKER